MARKKAAAAHGGAWKVAYADFVTAMMALFMVLWICSQDRQIMISTARYFQNPFTSPLTAYSGIMPFERPRNLESSSSSTDTSGQNTPQDTDKQIQLAFLNSVAVDFYRLLHLDDAVDQKPIDIQVTSDGLRLTLFDRTKQPMFTEGGSELTDWGRFELENLAWLIDRHKFRVTIDGHTRSHLVLKTPDYGPWELSADRANSARRGLVKYAVDPAMIERVAGYADTRPLDKEPPDAEANQRITISLTLVEPVPFKRGAAAPTGETATSSNPAGATLGIPVPPDMPFQPPHP